MAFQRPTLPELIDRTQQDLVSRLALAGPVLRRSLVHVLARVVAGAAHMLHGHVEYLSRQIFPDRSDRDFLVRQASLFGIRPHPATFAEAEALASGTDGALIPARSLLLRADGAEYETTTDEVIAKGSARLSLTARIASAEGSLEKDTTLSFESPLPGVTGTVVVTASAARGADEESTDSLRARLIARMQSPPHGGNAADYVAWAREVPGVTRAWASPREMGAGSVTVRFVRDDDTAMIPNTAAIAAVQSHIDGLRPVTADAIVLAPIPSELCLKLALKPNTEATRAAVRAEITDFLRRFASPGGTISISKLRVSLAQTDGVEDCTLLSPTTDVAHERGHLATLGHITWS